MRIRQSVEEQIGRRRYAAWEDAYGLAVASVMIAVGVHLLHAASITVGGTVGLSLMFSHTTGVSYGVLSILMNAPLFLFGWRMKGLSFIGKSLVVTILTALLVAWIPHWMTASGVEPAFAAVAGGTIVGMGALAAARHGAAAGGSLIVVLWLQERLGINGGLAQLVLDLLIVLLAILLLGWSPALWSALGIIATDAMIITWHRPRREDAENSLARAP